MLEYLEKRFYFYEFFYNFFNGIIGVVMAVFLIMMMIIIISDIWLELDVVKNILLFINLLNFYSNVMR